MDVATWNRMMPFVGEMLVKLYQDRVEILSGKRPWMYSSPLQLHLAANVSVCYLMYGFSEEVTD